jgi:hypothetical protein
MKKKILIRAPLLSRSGYGEQSRRALRALRNRDDLFDIYILNIEWGQTSHVTRLPGDELAWIHSRLLTSIMFLNNGGTVDSSLQITIPNEFEKTSPDDIGYTAGIETTKVAPQWIEKCNEAVDRLITISEHSKKVLLETSYDVKDQRTGREIKGYRIHKPIEVINYPVYDNTPEEVEIKFITTKNFLTISQWGPRKNLDNTIRWFIEEFRDDADVGLVVKTNLICDSIMDRTHTGERLRQLIDSCGDASCKVYLIHGDLTEGQLTWLYQHPTMKAFINLAHGEGYGLPLFEAAYNGLPLVTVTWSGQMDFICKPNKNGKRVPMVSRVDYDLREVQPEAVWEGVIQADSKWAYARENSYKRALRDILQKEVHFKTKATSLQKYILENFSEEKIYHQFAEAVFGAPLPPKVTAAALPKISLITSVYNAADHIEQLMENITQQTIFEDKCEWILLDANPPGQDFEEGVILKYVEQFPNNIIYKRLENDEGVYATWNEAIKMSTGELITNINCDDRRAPHGLESQAMFLHARPLVDVTYNDSYITHQPNILWETLDKNNTQRYNFEEFSCDALLRGNLPHNNPMWRATMHEKHGYFEEKYRSAGDWEFWLRSAFEGAKFAKNPEILGVYYFNPQGISTNFENFSWKQEEEKEVYLLYRDRTVSKD